ncbi:hypothetical protein NECID01_1906 [Nematocida sp. AWRm77]|nr:hypothetical protein NECID01_1906 [Nematocida sp. AWRm77]
MYAAFLLLLVLGAMLGRAAEFDEEISEVGDSKGENQHRSTPRENVKPRKGRSKFEKSKRQKDTPQATTSSTIPLSIVVMILGASAVVGYILGMNFDKLQSSASHTWNRFMGSSKEPLESRRVEMVNRLVPDSEE